MLITILILTRFTIVVVNATNENGAYEGHVDKTYKNGSDWRRFCVLAKPEKETRPFTHCTVNMNPYETLGIKCPRFQRHNYDLFPIQENHVFTLLGNPAHHILNNKSVFLSEHIESISKNLTNSYNKDGYNIILYNNGNNDSLKIIYFSCGIPNIKAPGNNVFGHMVSLIEIVLLPPYSEDNPRKYDIILDSNPLALPYQRINFFREIDHHGIYDIKCASTKIEVENQGDIPIISNNGTTGTQMPLSPKYEYNMKTGNRLSSNDNIIENLISVSKPNAKLNVSPIGNIIIKGSDIIKHITPNSTMIKLLCKCHSYSSTLYSKLIDSIFLPFLNTNTANTNLNNSFTFSIPTHLKFPICSPHPEKAPYNYEYNNRVVCKYNASHISFSTLYCPKETHNFDIDECKHSLYNWQEYRSNKSLFVQDFNIIPLANEYYLFLYKDLISPFAEQLLCTCKPKTGNTNEKDVTISIKPKLSCDFTATKPLTNGIINNLCNRLIRPGDSLVVICKDGDILYPKKELAYFGDTSLPFKDIEFKGVKRSDLNVTTLDDNKFLINLPNDTKAFLGQQYVFSCSRGKGIRETGFPIKSTGVIIVTTGNPNFPQSTDKKLPTLVKKLNQTSYGYYNLQLSHGELELECKNYINETTEQTSALYPIDWTDAFSSQPRAGLDPKTMPTVHPNQFMGFHGISIKKLPEKQKIPSNLSISIKSDAIILSRVFNPLYFICTDQTEDSVWDSNKGRFAVFEIEFNLKHTEMIGCGVYPSLFNDINGDIMTHNNCSFNISNYEKIGFHCPLSFDNPDPPVCYSGKVGASINKNEKIEIFKRPDDLYELRSLWIFTKDMLKGEITEIECHCIINGQSVAKINISSVYLYIIPKFILLSLFLLL